VYIEPTPYIVALVDELRRNWDGSIEVYYIAVDVSQPWRLQLDNGQQRLLPRGLFASLRTLWRVLKRDRRQTIVHLAGWGNVVLLGALLIARSLAIPVAVESDMAVGRVDRSLLYWLKKLFYPFLFRLPSRFLPGGTPQVQYLARFGAKLDRMTVAQMTVDVCAIRRFCAGPAASVRCAARRRWGVTAAERVVLYVGRLEKDKGVHELLAAFAAAAATENSLRLVIVGDGTLRPRVEAVASSADSRVSYLGRLSGNDVLRAYLSADLLVLPSLFEPWGLVVNEAMACGLPVIVSDRVGCARDLVRPAETGLIVSSGCVSELASAICELTGDDAARRHMGQAAERLISHWTLQNEASNIISAWVEIAR